MHRSFFTSVALAVVAVPLLRAPLLGTSDAGASETSDPVAVERVTPPVASWTPVHLDASSAVREGLDPDVLSLALRAITCAVRLGDMAAPPTLTVIDYSRRSTEPRLWVFDLASGQLLFRELVAHGRNSGEDRATSFSDQMNSHQTSLGLFTTADTYVGSNGYSLRLDGLEAGFNGSARERAIVMHGAPYVDAAFAAANGRLGRSWGCPALRDAIARDLIDTVRGGGAIFSYYPDDTWLTGSRYLGSCGVADPGTSLSAQH